MILSYPPRSSRLLPNGGSLKVFALLESLFWLESLDNTGLVLTYGPKFTHNAPFNISWYDRHSDDLLPARDSERSSTYHYIVQFSETFFGSRTLT
jgi:hypothetical protein